MRAAARQADAVDVREAVRRLIWVTDYIGYDEAGAFAADILQAAGAIGDLIDAGAAAQALEVVREAIEWLGQSLGMVDDSSGDVGGAAFELMQVHLLACQAAKPDPVELAACQLPGAARNRD